ncbi:MAG: DUF4198 domain-containing protein [Burkholderiales bacterium]|jgi:hypothetical protein|nr:DUF4198 domain-containing protein [Burkholderiales bacterium]
MKQKTLFRTFFAGIATLGLCAAANAHQIWLEQPEGENAVIRFGEFNDNLRETSPGLLDNFGSPAATLWTKGEAKSLAPAKTATGFVLPVRLKAGESLTAEDAAFPIRAFKRDGQEIRSWYWPAARFITDDAAQEPKLTFDITPTGKAGEFKLTFKGQPLARTEAHIVVQSGWSKSAHSSAEGLVQFDLPWRGQYVVEASHIDRTPGERQGEKYDGINYVTTLTLVRPDGVAPLPAGPAAKPNPGRPAQ